MDEISRQSRVASGAVVLLNLLALVSPVRADGLDMPGGYRLEFLWHQFHWLKRPLNFEVLFVVGAAMLLFGIFVHTVRTVSKSRMLGLITAAFAAQLVTRLLIDIVEIMHYCPPFRQDPWRAFAFLGGLSCLTSLCIQAAIVVQTFGRKPDNKANRAEETDARFQS